MKVVFVTSSYGILYLMWVKFRATYDKNDTFRIEFLVIPCFLLSLAVNHEFAAMEVLWTFSIYLESVAILPQLFMLYKTDTPDTFMSYYLPLLGSYRALYIVNWIYHYHYQAYFDLIKIVAGVVQTAPYVVYLCGVISRSQRKQFRPSLDNINYFPESSTEAVLHNRAYEVVHLGGIINGPQSETNASTRYMESLQYTTLPNQDMCKVHGKGGQ